MKTLVAAGLVLSALTAGSAMAADYPVKARPVAAPAAVYNWTGCYVGSIVGGGWGRVRDHTNSLGSIDPTAPFKIDGYMSGGDVGCNYQVGAFVLGVEGDLSWAYKT